MTEQFVNYASLSLALNCAQGDATITVSNGSLLPTAGTFRLLIDSEILLAISRTGNVVSVTRATEGTLAAFHLSGTPVIPIVSAGSLAQFKLDVIPKFTPAAFGATGDGVVDDTPAFTSMLAAIGSTSAQVYILRGLKHRLASSLTIPANVQLSFEVGTSLAIDSGRVLTVSGEILAGRMQTLFTGPAGVALTPGQVTCYGASVLRPEWFGCPCDGVHDDLPGMNALNAALSVAATNNGAATVECPRGTMYFSDHLHLTKRPILQGAGPAVNNAGTTWSFAAGKQPWLDGVAVSPDGGDATDIRLRHLQVNSLQLMRGPAFGFYINAVRAASSFYEKGNVVQSASVNTNVFWRVTARGTTASGGDPAAFASTTTPGTVVTDGTVTWTSEAYIKDWVANHAYVVGQRVMQPGEQRYMFECQIAGTSGGSAPALFASPEVNHVIVDGGVTWVERRHSMVLQCPAYFEDFLVQGFTNFGLSVQAGAGQAYNNLNTNADFSGGKLMFFNYCGGGIFLRGFDSNGTSWEQIFSLFMGDVQGYEALSASGRTVLNTKIGTGGITIRDNSIGATFIAGCYSQNGNGPGFWLDPTGGNSIALGCNSENAYPSFIGQYGTYIGSSTASFSSDSIGLMIPGPVGVGQTGLFMRDSNAAAPVNNLQAFVGRNDGKTFWLEQGGNESQGSGTCLSNALPGWPVGWHVWTQGLNQVQGTYATAGPNALLPGGQTAPEYPLWLQSRLLIGDYAHNVPSIDFGTAPPVGTNVFYTAGSVRWNIAPSSSNPIGWACTVNGAPGTWKSMPNLP